MAEGAINPDDELVVTMLGAGQEVGRSCHLLEFKGKKILLDIGIHPGISGLNGLPFMDYTDPEKIDILLIRNHFISIFIVFKKSLLFKNIKMIKVISIWIIVVVFHGSCKKQNSLDVYL